jgi:hypothetical protein
MAKIEKAEGFAPHGQAVEKCKAAQAEATRRGLLACAEAFAALAGDELSTSQPIKGAK